MSWPNARRATSSPSMPARREPTRWCLRASTDMVSAISRWRSGGAGATAMPGSRSTSTCHATPRPASMPRGKTVCVVGDTLFTGGGQDKLYVSTDGRHFAARPSPCDHTQDLALYQVVATSARDVDELCIGDPGMSRAIRTVYRSTETGKTTQCAGQAVRHPEPTRRVSQRQPGHVVGRVRLLHLPQRRWGFGLVDAGRHRRWGQGLE